MKLTSIQIPSSSYLDQLGRLATAGFTGPQFVWEEARSLFLFVFMRDGDVAHWSLQPCPDAATAEVLKGGILETLGTMHSEAFLALLPPDWVADMDKAASVALKKH